MQEKTTNMLTLLIETVSYCSIDYWYIFFMVYKETS